MMDASSSLGALPETNFEVGSCLMEKTLRYLTDSFNFYSGRISDWILQWKGAGEPVFEA